MEKKGTWGGKRENAGRPRGVETRLISIKLERELLEALPSGLNRSKYINEAVRAHMIKDGLIEEKGD